MTLDRIKQQRFLFLDSLRALAAIYVVMHHAVLQYYFFVKDMTTVSNKEKILLRLFWDGHLSVNLFIVLSGFSLMIVVTKNNHELKGGAWTFFKRRVIRIIPPYYIALLVSFFLAKWLLTDTSRGVWDIAIPVTYSDLYIHLLMLHDFFVSHGTKINYALWSISVEFRLYLFFPFLVWLWRKKGLWASLLISIILVIVFSIALIIGKSYYPEINLEISGVTPYILLFMMGVVASDTAFSEANYAKSIRKFYQGMSVLTIVVVFIISLILYKVIPSIFERNQASTPYNEFILQEIKDIIFGLISANFLFSCAVPAKPSVISRWIFKMLNWRPLVFVGMFSYSLYLIHPPLLKLLSKFVLSAVDVSNFTKACLLVVGGIPVILLVSYLFFFLFERPFLVLGRKRKLIDVEVATAEQPAP